MYLDLMLLEEVELLERKAHAASVVFLESQFDDEGTVQRSRSGSTLSWQSLAVPFTPCAAVLCQQQVCTAARMDTAVVSLTVYVSTRLSSETQLAAKEAQQQQINDNSFTFLSQKLLLLQIALPLQL